MSKINSVEAEIEKLKDILEKNSNLPINDSGVVALNQRITALEQKLLFLQSESNKSPRKEKSGNSSGVRTPNGTEVLFVSISFLISVNS
jgi:hypothetical protein